MPLRNIYTIRPGTGLDLDAAGFQNSGPRIQVEVGLHPSLEAYLQNDKKPVPSPLIGIGLVDTGASITSVDEGIISSLEIPPIGTCPVYTPSGSAVQQLHACKISFPGTLLSPITFSSVCGAKLRDQGIDVLLGRDVLANYVLIYNGPGAHFTLAG